MPARNEIGRPLRCLRGQKRDHSGSHGSRQTTWRGRFRARWGRL